MITVTATKAYALIDEANASHEPIQITGKRGNAVLISEDDWRSINETLHLQSIPGMVDSIQKARAEGIERASTLASPLMKKKGIKNEIALSRFGHRLRSLPRTVWHAAQPLLAIGT